MKKILIAAATAALAIAAGPATAQAPAADPAFAAKLRAVLASNPEIITEALQAAQAKQRAQQNADIEAKVAPLRAQLFAKDFGPIIGNPNGTVTVVEFVDYACPVCKTAHASINNIIAKRKEVRVTIAMRLIFGEPSERLARFALASDLQGRFAQTHDALYDAFGDHHDTKPTDEALKAVATKAGIDYARAIRDMNGPKVNAVFTRQTDVANKIGVGGTPFFVTRDAIYPGAAPEEQMSQAFR